MQGIYCTKCFLEVGSECILCKSPIEFGDESDFSEEVDSSEGLFWEADQKNNVKGYFESLSLSRPPSGPVCGPLGQAYKRLG